MAERERRKYPRRSFKKTIGVLSRGAYLLTRGIELGEGGLMFWVPTAIDTDIHLVLSFKVPNHDFIVIHGEVRNRHETEGEFRYGVEFKDLNFEDRRCIRDYIASKTEQESEKEFQRKREKASRNF